MEELHEQSLIDFDALYAEYYNSLPIVDIGRLYKNTSTIGFLEFLKSKNICAPVKRELPVKTIYRIKPEFEAIFKDLGYDDYISECHDHLPENIQNVEKYYDYTETPDYSQVKVGDVVEIYHSLSNKPNYGIVQKNSNNILSIICNMNSINAFCITYSQIKSLTILKASE